MGHFKCFESALVPLTPLTLLTGLNASGKSSLIQVLVLLSQTIKANPFSRRLLLNGAGANLGTVTDVIDELSGQRFCDLGIGTDEFECAWYLSGERSEMSLEIRRGRVNGQEFTPEDDLYKLIPRTAIKSAAELHANLENLSYLSAERIGPRDVYDLRDRHLGTSVGARGEFAPSVLYSGSEDHCEPLPGAPDGPPTLYHQVRGWLGVFFPNADFEVQRIPNSAHVTLGLKTAKELRYYMPQNVGFGITQVFPILVAALAAGPGTTLAIENPEVHLHPAGQTLMGTFLSTVARRGVQVIVETHSDHVLSGARRAVKSGLISPGEITVHFFRPRGGADAQITSPQMDAEGNFDSWPPGFFDQFDKDASYFAGWGP
jgi:predicted ATPase